MRSTHTGRGRTGRAVRPLLAMATMIGTTLAACGVMLVLTTTQASAHLSPITITCETVTVSYSAFPASGTNSATVTINGTPTPITWMGATHTFSVTRPAGPVSVSTTWTGSDGVTGSASKNDDGSSCRFPTTTTSTSTSTTSTSTTSTSVRPPTVPPGSCSGPASACNPQPTTTTSPAPTTTSPTVSVVPAVQPETAPPTTSAGSTVSGESVVSSGSTVGHASLASTGSDLQGLTWLGLVLAGAGSALLGLAGRRRWSRSR